MLRTRALVLLSATLLCLLLVPQRAVASGAHAICQPPLLPLSSAEGIRLEAVVLSAEITCQDDACRWHATQAYHLRNTLNDRAVTLRLGTGRLPESCLAEPLPSLALSGAGSLSPLDGESADGAMWETQLPPGASQRLTLTRELIIPTRYLLRWEWDGRLLASWGRADGARIELRLPTLYPHDALLYVAPDRRGFDGYRLVWNYEDAEIPLHSATMLTPPTARRLSELRRSGAHAELARLYLHVQKEAADNGWAVPDYSFEILAELSAAAVADPTDPQVTRDLAELYLQRVAEDPTQQLNYLLLAARQLERLQNLLPGDEAVRQELCRTYYRVATAASEANDPANALAYLRRADDMGGATLVPEFAGTEELYLRWAVGLARQGRIEEAYAEVADRLRPETRDVLLRYAPPLTGLHIESHLAPGAYVLVYHLRLYPPVAAQVRNRLEQLIALLNATHPTEAHVAGDGHRVRLELRVPFVDPQDMKDHTARLVQALEQEHDLLATIVAAPLQGHLRAYHVDRLLLRDRFVYQHDVDLSALASRWEQEGEYALWRIIELNSYRPDAERDRLEQELALLALREQAAVWGYVPLGGHLRAYLTAELPKGYALPEPRAWTVAWGQARTLTWEWSFWHWRRILPMGGAAVLLIALGACSSMRKRDPSG